MNVAIAGASGFVGAYVGEVIRRSGISVKELDGRLIRNVSAVSELRDSLRGVNVLVNLIGRFELPFADQVEANVSAAFTLYSAAVDAQIGKVIHISAAAAYGSSTGHQYLETDILAPDTPYGLSKKMGEQVLLYFSDRHALSYVMLRPTNIYGKGGVGVIQQFVNSYKTVGSITISGNGEQTRDFVHVLDVAEAIRLSLSDSIQNEVFNVSSGNPVTLNDMARTLEEVVGSKVPVVTVPEPAGHVRNLLADNTKARKMLGWNPSHTLEEALRDLISSS